VKASAHTPRPATKAMPLIHLQLKQKTLPSGEYTGAWRLLEDLGFHNEAAIEPAGFEARCDVIVMKFAAAELAP